MANTLGSGITIPEGTDRISATGVEEMRKLGVTADTALRSRASVSQVIAAQNQIDTLAGEVDTRLDGIQSAYDVAVADGFTGTQAEWLASLEGPEGPTGPYGGTEVTAPQVAAMVESDAAVRAALDARYRRTASVLEYGATGDGDTDDTAAVQAALTDVAGGAVYFPPGAYRLTGPLNVPAGTSISGADSSSVLLDWSTMPEFTSASLLCWEKGSLDRSTPLTVAPQVGDVTVTVTSGHEIQVGDWVRITADETAVSGEAVKAEFQRVIAVSGAVLSLGGAVFDSYSLELSARVERANLVTGALAGVSVRGKGINPSGYGDSVVDFSLAREVTISDVKFHDVENKCLLFKSVVGLDVDRCFFRFDPSFTPLQYGVALTGACQMVSMRGCSSWNDRHMLTTSTSTMLQESVTENRGIPRVITVTGCTANGSWQAPIDTHRGGEYLTIVGNALSSESTAIKIRGANALISGNTITGKSASLGGSPFGVRIGMVCDNVRVTGNVIRGFSSGVRIETPDSTTNALVVTGNTISDCQHCVYLGTTATVLDGVVVSSNYLEPVTGGYAVYISTTVNDLDVSGNVLVGGAGGVYVASNATTLTRFAMQGNTIRGQSSYGAYLRATTDGFVASNFSADREIRFTNANTRVTAAMNQCTVTDLSTDRNVTIK